MLKSWPTFTNNPCNRTTALATRRALRSWQRSNASSRQAAPRTQPASWTPRLERRKPTAIGNVAHFGMSALRRTDGACLATVTGGPAMEPWAEG